MRRRSEPSALHGGKKVKGRKRHIVVDSQGFIVGVLVTEGNTPERLGAAMVILEHQKELSNTEVIWVRESKIRQSSGDDLRGRAAAVILV